jgi:hypothetical protein
VEGVLGELVAKLVFGLVGLFGCGEKGEIAGLAFFIQGEDEGNEGEVAEGGWLSDGIFGGMTCG